MSARAMPMRSASPSRKIRSASTGFLIRPKATTGSGVARVRAAFRWLKASCGTAAARNLHPEAAERPRVGAEEVDMPARRERPADREAVVEVVAEGGVLVQAEADRDEPVGADRRPHRREHLEGEAHALLERAAVGVLPAVEERRDEAAQEAVVADLDLDPVEARVAHVRRRRRKAFDDRLDLRRPHLDGVVAPVGLGHLRGRPELLRRVAEGGVPGMVELGEDVRAVGMDRSDEPPVGRDRLPVPRPAVIGAHLSDWMHGMAAGHDETRPALRPRGVVGGEVQRRRAVRRIEPVPVGEQDEAVAKLDSAEAKRRPEQRIGVHRSTLSLRASRRPERFRFTRKRSGLFRSRQPALWPAPSRGTRAERTMRGRRIRGGPQSRPVASPSKTDSL